MNDLESEINKLNERIEELSVYILIKYTTEDYNLPKK